MYPIGINSSIFASSGHLSKLFGKPDLTLWDVVFHSSQKWWEEPEVVGGARKSWYAAHLLTSQWELNTPSCLVVQSCLTVLRPKQVAKLFATWIVAGQALQSVGFSRQEYWSGLPFLFPGDLGDPGIKPASPALHADYLPLSHQGSPK